MNPPTVGTKPAPPSSKGVTPFMFKPVQLGAHRTELENKKDEYAARMKEDPKRLSALIQYWVAVSVLENKGNLPAALLQAKIAKKCEEAKLSFDMMKYNNAVAVMATYAGQQKATFINE